MWTRKNIGNQASKTMVVTGANAGIGYETTLALYEAGAKVVITCRDKDKAAKTIESLKKQNGSGVLEPGILDLSSLESVKKFADNFCRHHTKLDVLINNAGVMIPPKSKTTEGYELQFGVNFLGHFALTGYLYPLLKATPSSRIITLSSLAYLHGKVDFENLKSEKSYEPMREYCQSKLANLFFSLELQRRMNAKGDKVLSIAVQPGANRTELSRHMSDDLFTAAVKRVGELMDPSLGALTSLFAAVSDEVSGGELYGPDKDGGYRGFPARSTIAEAGLNKVDAKKLWEKAEEVTGIIFP